MKKILFAAASLAAMTLASCADMLAPESDMVMYEEDNKISSVNDTLFSVMGTIHLMQQIADRTNLLGEVRADLVTPTPAASIDLQQLSQNMTDAGNAYNRPEDYYAIINNCNYFILHADSTLSHHSRPIFERELAVMHTFRAWAYLQLAITYGEIPYYTQFLGTLADANQVMLQPRKGITDVCNLLIDDLRPYIATYELDYGMINGLSSRSFFIPVRVMLGELCLWAGRYHDAARYYHDYLTDIDHPRPIGLTSTHWYTGEVPSRSVVSGYYSLFQQTDEILAFIPMETNTFYGTVSYLQDIYTSTSDNDYYYQLTWSEANIQLSKQQAYYYEYEDPNTHVRDTISMSNDSIYNREQDRKRHGDLRLADLVSERSTGGNPKYNDTYQDISKFDNSRMIPLYRLGTIYLHYAEALNRAGFPSAAFAILKYGLSNETTQRNEGDAITAYEREKAGDLITFNNLRFNHQNTQGIHARGCGDVFANPEYVLPMPGTALASAADTIAYQQPLVEDLIIDELALETCFEGLRFYDLMRVAIRRNNPAYLADRVALRSGQTDEALRARLMDVGNWFLPMK